jgi:hypothetical protein
MFHVKHSRSRNGNVPRGTFGRPVGAMFHVEHSTSEALATPSPQPSPSGRGSTARVGVRVGSRALAASVRPQ